MKWQKNHSQNLKTISPGSNAYTFPFLFRLARTLSLPGITNTLTHRGTLMSQLLGLKEKENSLSEDSTRR